MASKAKKGTPAPTSKKPVVRRDGKPTMAEKSAQNKATFAAAKNDVRVTVSQVKQIGAATAAPLIADLIGRSIEWSETLEEALYALISTGHGMEAISKMDGMPTLYRMLRWLGDDTHPFSTCYARAKQSLVPLYEEMAQRIASSPNLGEIRTEKQVLTKDGNVVDVVETRYVDNVERSKLAVQTMQWTLGHLKPKKHGPKPETNEAGANTQLQGLIAAINAGPVKRTAP